MIASGECPELLNTKSVHLLALPSPWDPAPNTSWVTSNMWTHGLEEKYLTMLIALVVRPRTTLLRVLQSDGLLYLAARGEVRHQFIPHMTSDMALGSVKLP